MKINEMKLLCEYLGIWKVETPKGHKYWMIDGNTNGHFIIKWGNSLDELIATKSYIRVLDAQEAYNRIVSKACSGYTHINSNLHYENLKCSSNDVADTTIVTDIKIRVQEYLKQRTDKKLRKKKKIISIFDWLADKENN